MTIKSLINNVPLLSSQFCKAYTVKFWILFKFYAITVFIRKCDKKTSHRLSCTFWKNFLQNVTNRERFVIFKIIVTKYDKRLSQIVTGITKCEKRLLESVTIIIKWDVTQVILGTVTNQILRIKFIYEKSQNNLKSYKFTKMSKKMKTSPIPRSVFRILSSIYERAFCKNSHCLQEDNYFCKKASSDACQKSEYA